MYSLSMYVDVLPDGITVWLVLSWRKLMGLAIKLRVYMPIYYQYPAGACLLPSSHKVFGTRESRCFGASRHDVFIAHLNDSLSR